MHNSEFLIGEILAAEARGYLLKSDAKAALLAAVEALAAHKPYFTRHTGLILTSGDRISEMKLTEFRTYSLFTKQFQYKPLCLRHTLNAYGLGTSR